MWTEDEKQIVIDTYNDANPTPATSKEIIESIAEDTGKSANSIRSILSKAGVYIKAESSRAKASASSGSEAKEKKPRVSKADSIAELVTIIESQNLNVDSDIIDKLTGKQAIYFTAIISECLKNA